MFKKENFKPTKTYDEYIEIFKFACEELGRSITPSELEKHKFGLPSAIWLIKNSNENIKSLNDLLESLGYKPIKKRNPKRKYTYEIAYEEFKKRGFILLPQKYTSCAIPLMFICPKHPNIIQYKSLNSLIFGNEGAGVGCDYCRFDNRMGELNPLWKGGISPLHVYLRESIDKWKKDSLINSNYKCVITGERFDAIHHVYSFNKILKEVIDECGLPIHRIISDYTTEELNLLKSKNREIHSRYPLGVCLCKEVHDLYHNLYKDDNTPEQFEEFKERYNNGEFASLVAK